jgi:iron(III) transport system ATP-binding protein
MLQRPAARSLTTVEAAPVCIDVVEVVKRFDGDDVLREVTLDVAAGETLALLGPSGCGKTTLLRSIAGLERTDAGSISIDQTTVSGPRVHHSPESRHIGMVFQDWALFPHLTVGENVSYGLSRSDRRSDRVEATLALVGLDGLGKRMPATLSGGQQQRVALARAIAPRPRAILLDEPFSNLDTSLRVQVRTEVHRLLGDLGVTTVFVTHDQEEAFVLGDRVAVMHDGKVEQLASPVEVYERPSTRWVADFVGEANLIPAYADGQVAVSVLGRHGLRDHHRGPVDVLLRPEDLAVDARHDGASEQFADGNHSGNTTNGTVELVEYYGHDHVSIVALDDGTPVRCRAAGAPVGRRGQRVTVRSTAPCVESFPAL